MTAKKKLEQDALKASRMEQTLSTNGWQDILQIIESEYFDCLGQMIDRESPEARGGIKSITRIMDSISQDMKFGENARIKYRKQFLGNQTPNEG